MSDNDYYSWNDRRTRRRESLIEEMFVSEAPAEPIEVEESDPTATWIGRIFRWPKGTP